ncbi:hypothetical protein [Actinoplanes sp. M2I2]|uniref:hypothetical protein n=1 Tax=Actinoplanes sp. M2I2 TaxID=1734444 RepID=UPI00201FD18C|nr:hypothetical protein [Actinoplanes sp. M2I2]
MVENWGRIDAAGQAKHLRPYREPDFWTFHSPAWRQRLSSRSGVVEDVRADTGRHLGFTRVLARRR